jgi:hypothetical protein
VKCTGWIFYYNKCKNSVSKKFDLKNGP